MRRWRAGRIFAGLGRLPARARRQRAADAARAGAGFAAGTLAGQRASQGLWATAAFSAASPAATPLALELTYLRDFKAQDIAERSLKEMRRSQPLNDAQAARWKADLLRVIPDVRAGDRILGVHRPGQGATFWVNDKPAGEVRDEDFSARFFGIWLSPATSEPQMRAALLAGAAP